MAQEIKTLNEKEQKVYNEVLESAKNVPERDKPLFEKLLKNQITDYLRETSFSGDQAVLGDIVLPIFKRSFTNQFMRNIVGTQPLNSSTGYAFSLRYNYDGNSTQKSDLYGSSYTRLQGGLTDKEYTTDYETTLADFVRKVDANTAIVLYDTTANRSADTNGNVAAGASAFNDGTGDLAGFKIVYTEDNKALVLESGSGATIASLKALIGTGSDIQKVYDNEAAYAIILKDYSGPFTTANGEVLGNKIPELGVSIDKQSVEAKTRKYKSRFTLESEQDLKANHGLDMKTEMINLQQYEVGMATDRELLDAVNTAAALNPNANADFDVSTEADGRFQAEKFRAVYTELIRQSNLIATTTFRHPGNVIIGTSDVITMLESLNSFSSHMVSGDLNSGIPVSDPGQSYAGSLGGRFQVYRDVFSSAGTTANNDYATVCYSNPNSALDSGIVYLPYIPYMSKMVSDQESGNPSIISMARYAIMSSPFGSQNYYSKTAFSNIFKAS